MKTLERARLLAKNLEFRIPATTSRLLAPMVGLSSPYRSAEHRLRCIFIHVPKAAGTSVARALFDEKSRHIPISRYFAFDPEAARSYFKFAFVRNPWARMYSAYHYLARRIGADPRYPDHRWATHYLADTGDFGGFLHRMKADRSYRNGVRRYIHFRDQLDWVRLPHGKKVAVDFIGRYERVAEDFAEVANRIGVDTQLPHERVGAKHDFGEYFTPENVAFVGDLYQQDVRRFNYEFDS